MKRYPFGTAIMMVFTSILLGAMLVTPACRSQEPRDDAREEAAEDARDPRGAPSLRSNQVRDRHLITGAVSARALAFKSVTVNVNAAATTGSSAADPQLTTASGSIVVSCDPSGNQDQHMDNHVLNADGSITVTLAAAATAQNNFRCIAIRGAGTP